MTDTPVSISLDPLLQRAADLERQAAALREQAARLDGQAEGLREAARLIAAQAQPADPSPAVETLEG